MAVAGRIAHVAERCAEMHTVGVSTAQYFRVVGESAMPPYEADQRTKQDHF